MFYKVIFLLKLLSVCCFSRNFSSNCQDFRIDGRVSKLRQVLQLKNSDFVNSAALVEEEFGLLVVADFEHQVVPDLGISL